MLTSTPLFFSLSDGSALCEFRWKTDRQGNFCERFDNLGGKQLLELVLHRINIPSSGNLHGFSQSIFTVHLCQVELTHKPQRLQPKTVSFSFSLIQSYSRHEIALFCFSLKSTTGPQKQHENDRNCPFPSHLLVWIQTIVWRISCLYIVHCKVFCAIWRVGAVWCGNFPFLALLLLHLCITSLFLNLLFSKSQSTLTIFSVPY